MTKISTALLLTTALCMPSISLAQSAETACRDLDAILATGLPQAFDDRRDDLATVVEADDGDVCLTRLVEVREAQEDGQTGAVVADTAQTTLTLQDEVVVEGVVLLDQEPPQVNVESGETDVEIEPGSPTVTVAEPQGEIIIRQAPANVTIDMPVPTIRIEQAAPQIIITMPDPTVSVGAAQPQVRVVQADPTITVTQSPPSVDLQLRRAEEGTEGAGFQVTDNRTGLEYQPGARPDAITTEDANINFTSGEPRVSLKEPTEQATVRLERSEPTIRFEQSDPVVSFTSAGEPQVEFMQSGEPTVTFEQAAVEQDDTATDQTASAALSETPTEDANTVAQAVSNESADAPVATEEAMSEDTTEEVAAAESAETDTTVETTADVQLTGPQVEREGYNMVQIGEIEADTLIGKYVYGVQDEDVGDIGDLVLDENGTVSQVVIEVGGFLGMGEKNVAVPFEELSILRSNDDDVRVYIDATEEQLEAMPEFEK